ncbi:MAG TPA: hypothetical protein PK055_09425 [Gammaproteobacteria bacterium]|nr:hypothetical protein [Xanthomonadales bacterium]MCB1593551.1 hypothetical protein [Xanthomonadales bacterium]HPI96512.1 hypothetical protein [Gammaproteobacteria bacterium]HPQ87865.1 hypothetical protein [Gammaproteobacteria bacterium]
MKFIFIIITALYSFRVYSEDSIIELNSDNLIYLALKNNPEMIEKHINFLINSRYIIDSEEKKEILLEKTKSEIDKKLLEFSNIQKFKISDTVRLKTNKSHDRISVDGIFDNPIHAIFRSHNPHPFFPDYFFLLIANYHSLNIIDINNSLLSDMIKSKELKYFVEIILTISNYQHNKSFQTVIKEINIYSDDSKSKLLFSKNETSNHEEIIKNWFFANGVSNPHVGIHAFTVFGYRLQDMAKISFIYNQNCKDGGNVSSHQVYVCASNYSDNVNLEAIFIGGRLGIFRILASPALTEFEKEDVAKKLSQDLNTPLSFSDLAVKKWNKYRVDFKFNPNLDFKVSEIFSMIPYGTKEILAKEIESSL